MLTVGSSSFQCLHTAPVLWCYRTGHSWKRPPRRWVVAVSLMNTNRRSSIANTSGSLRGWARIGVLVSRLRGMVDNIIALKVNDPQANVQESEVIKMVTKLIELDGLDA